MLPSMGRYAILDDNQQVLEERVRALRQLLPPLVHDRVCAILVIGSVAEGRARDGSDIDILLVLRDGSPRRADYTWWEDVVAPSLANLGRAFPIQPVFIARTSLATSEPHLRSALGSGFPLWDPEGIFDDQLESRP
jgi:hypothetical protein